MIIDQTFTVTYNYPVWFGRGLLYPEVQIFEQIFGSLPRCAVCVEQALVEANPALYERLENRFMPVLPPIVVPSGERAKEGLDLQQSLLKSLAEAELDRHCAVVAVGGGAMLDAVGLATALIHRGLRLIRVPTTSLAMADAAVGVKNGINWHGAKNFLGTFAPPFAVLNDFEFLETLPVARRKDVLAESFKVAIIKDETFFNQLVRDAELLNRGEVGPLEPIIAQTAQLHLDHIATGGDPFEMGSARPLDFGHWAAHKLEVLSDYQLSHGQAVAIGIALDSRYARNIGLISPEACETIHTALQTCGLPTDDERLKLPSIWEGLEEFRAHLGGSLCITLPHGIGKKIEVHTIEQSAMQQALIG